MTKIGVWSFLGAVVLLLALAGLGLLWLWARESVPPGESRALWREPSPHPVEVQQDQCCPLCWELIVSPGASVELAECPGCQTVLHSDCAHEMGGGSTLGCSRASRRVVRGLRPAEPIAVAHRPRVRSSFA